MTRREIEPDSLRRWLEGLPHDAQEYAYRYSEHLSTGDREPKRGTVTPELAGEIRRRLRAEWGRRVWARRRA